MRGDAVFYQQAFGEAERGFHAPNNLDTRLLLSQALRGQSVLAPDGVTLALLASWVTLTIIAARWSSVESASMVQHVAA